MKPITEEQCQALIEHCKGEVAHLTKCIEAYPESPVVNMDLALREIALASLTADPVVTLYSDDRDEYQYTFELETSVPDGIHLLYTAPSVPVIKFPEMKDYAEPHTQYREGLVDGYNRCIAEIKRLNGLS